MDDLSEAEASLCDPNHERSTPFNPESHQVDAQLEAVVLELGLPPSLLNQPLDQKRKLLKQSVLTGNFIPEATPPVPYVPSTLTLTLASGSQEAFADLGPVQDDAWRAPTAVSPSPPPAPPSIDVLATGMPDRLPGSLPGSPHARPPHCLLSSNPL